MKIANYVQMRDVLTKIRRVASDAATCQPDKNVALKITPPVKKKLFVQAAKPNVQPVFQCRMEHSK